MKVDMLALVTGKLAVPEMGGVKLLGRNRAERRLAQRRLRRAGGKALQRMPDEQRSRLMRAATLDVQTQNCGHCHDAGLGVVPIPECPEHWPVAMA